ncbi:type VI secretion system ATPase TssH [Belnapia sp. T6]|uniref:Type VI secretion system ATPase TssH n=1 Tax=Belnapia mucosa TaxID=2804532 RepID=A0ABS1VAG1_9PROT|nr:type VI secretion system ATPase TssH [Belnapia mucosa]MBL6458654.1 type VI secretion system ATPase TssH [Belnapia mucosa]
MSTISRDVVFGKLGGTAMRTLREAFDLARLRGDGPLEPVHWLAILLRTEGSDLPLILERLGAAREEDLHAQARRALDALRGARSARLDFGLDLELAIERGWISASLVFGGDRIRTGHLLHAMLEEPRLRRLLTEISGAFRGMDAAALAARFQELTRGSAEAAESAAAEPSPSAAAAANAAAPPGRQGGALTRFTRDLTEEARAGRIDPVQGRDAEIRELVDILMRRRQNNPMVLGEAGVGKTALVEGLARRIAAGEVPEPMRRVRLLALDVAAMQAGASVRGEFESRLKAVVEEVAASERPVVLFIDEAHTLIGAGGAAGTGDAANLLKPALARGTLRTIAAATWSDYKRHIERDAALARRFQVVQVDEPTEAAATGILRGMAGVLEAHHGVQIIEEALASAVRLSSRYVQGRQLPDKAVALLDTACARVAMSQGATPPALEDTRRRIADLELESAALSRERRIGLPDPDREAEINRELAAARHALAGQESRYATERELVGRILELRAELRDSTVIDSGAPPEGLARLRGLQEELVALQGEAPLVLPAVDRQAVATIVEAWTGIPVGRMLTDEIDAVLGLEGALRRRVVGQDHALGQIARRIETARAGLEHEGKPKGVFLLVGPSGVGKTETALALAEQLFGSDAHIISINMSEFQEAHTVSTLKGAPPGYVGYGEGGRLTEAVRRRPYSIVLLDEVEKAHPDVHEIFFQVFDKGVMEDAEGRRIDFRNTLVILTSNVGSELVMRLAADPELRPEPETLARALREPLLRAFPAALLGRLTVVPYLPLDDETLGDIIRLQLGRIAGRVARAQGVPLTYDDTVVEFIHSRCTEAESGGRMIDGILTGTLLPAMSREILERLRDGRPLTRIHVGVADGRLVYAFD